MKHAESKAQEARLTKESDTRARRQGWATQLNEGKTLRELAASEPGVMGDSDFMSFWSGTKTPAGFEDVLDDEGNVLGQRGPDNRWHADPRAAPAPEIWETVEDPFGRGGVGQRSSTSGKITGYLGAPQQTREPDRRTATDKHGRRRYLDTGAPAFSDEILGPGPTPETPEGTPLKDQLKMVRDLSADWQKTTRPMQGLLDQSDRMNIGFQMAQNGDLLAGSQAILISFNKLLDPTSVVRESVYARSATGQSALETMRGFVDKLSRGGSGVTLRELETYRRFGEMVVENTLESTVGPERKRISRLAEFASVDPQLIFTGRFAQGDQQGGDQQGGVAAPSALSAPSTQLAPGTGQPAPRSAQASMTGQGEADPSRLAMYADLPKDALERQVVIMKSHESDYSAAELRAAALAWQAMFPGK